MPEVWNPVSLGSFLRRSITPIHIRPDESYRQITVRMHHKGVTLRGLRVGHEIGSTRQFVARAGQLIVSRIDARNGAIGLVPAELDRAIVTNDFWLFDLDPTRVDPRFLDSYVGTQHFVDLCQRASEGTTNRVRLRAERFLALTAPLPPLNEQRRIVARVSQLLARVEEARRLRREARSHVDSLLASALTTCLRAQSDRAEHATVQSIAVSVTDGDHQAPPRAEAGIPFILISNITSGRLDFSGCRRVPPRYFSGLAPARVPRRGDVLYTAVGATYGTPCLVDTDEPFCFQRHIAIIKPDRHRILPAYLLWALRSQDSYDQARRGVTGSAQPTVALRAIRAIQFPLPDLKVQERIADHMDALEARLLQVRGLQSATAGALDTLERAVTSSALRGELQ